MGVHHAWGRSYKDLFQRYQTMLGKYVERKGGWDCHGLPVEIAVEQKLGHDPSSGSWNATRSRPRRN